MIIGDDVSYMKVSVIVPTFRRDWELRRALCSLAEQTFSEFEIIIIDDNGDAVWRNKTLEILSEIRHNYAHIELNYIQNPESLGSALARNVGVQIAKGKYITFLDDDDEYLPEKIARQYAFMEQNNLDYSITDLDLYHENGKLFERRMRSYLHNPKQKSLLECHFKYHMTGTDTIMMKKTYFEEIGGFPPMDVGDEFYLIREAIMHNGAFGYLEGCDVKAYVHTGEAGGLSSGEGKICGEKKLYEYKKQFFSELSARSVRYIRMRHYAVLSFAGLRMRNYRYFMGYGFLSMISAPLQCVGMLWHMYRDNCAQRTEDGQEITAVNV